MGMHRFVYLAILLVQTANIVQSQEGKRCSLPMDIGPCKALLPRWWFNPETQNCEEFGYGGCKGNENNFETKEECQTNCASAGQGKGEQKVGAVGDFGSDNGAGSSTKMNLYAVTIFIVIPFLAMLF